jgi:hypothetical protein
MNQGVFRTMAAVLLIGFLGAAGWLIWQQTQEIRAPRDPGVCWRLGSDGKFAAIYRNSQGIEACAGDLERIHMKTGETLTGAYQGRYIFVDKEAIRSSDSLSGQRWRLYFDDQRVALDHRLNAHEMTFTAERQAPPSP